MTSPLSKEFLDEMRSKIDIFQKKISGLTEETASHKPTPDRWSIKQVIGHLIDSAANNHQRFIRLQNEDIHLPGYDQNMWVDANRYQGEKFSFLLNLWYSYNVHLLHLLSGVDEKCLSNKWHIPGGENLTLSFIIEDYFSHLFHHAKKIEERIE